MDEKQQGGNYLEDQFNDWPRYIQHRGALISLLGHRGTRIDEKNDNCHLSTLLIPKKAPFESFTSLSSSVLFLLLLISYQLHHSYQHRIPSILFPQPPLHQKKQYVFLRTYFILYQLSFSLFLSPFFLPYHEITGQTNVNHNKHQTLQQCKRNLPTVYLHFWKRWERKRTILKDKNNINQ